MRLTRWAAGVLVLLLAAAVAGGRARAAASGEADVYKAYGGSASCQKCHAEEFGLWAQSHHGQAERPVDFQRDGTAFVPARSILHGSQKAEVCLTNGQFEITTLGLSGREETFAVARVIGVEPLRQFLVPFPGGRMQTLEASYDPRSNAWFDAFGEEDRHPGEWGHWTGRGMNWNQMCAVCHNTRVLKNYDATNDSYRTTMAEPTVGCEACHGPLRAHNEWQERFGAAGGADPTVAKMSHAQELDTCGTCHARRDDLTGDFMPGDKFLNRYDLEMAGTENFYADGQIRDEDYEFSAFQGSRMAAHGVYCMDCHNPHSAKTVLPGNWLCLRCHGAGSKVAPVINPATHSHHTVHGFDTNGAPLSMRLADYDARTVKESGGECVNCHMPQTLYMQRHWRHDHGFTSPDPLLTQEFGIPNACNRCHADKSADWALAAGEKWYGAKLGGARRERAEAFARAEAGNAAGVGPLLALLAGPEQPYWKAAAANALAAWNGEPGVTAALVRALADTNALVRTKAAQALNAEVGEESVREALRACWQDPVRSVRLAAAGHLMAEIAPGDAVAGEWERFLSLNADQPGGQLELGAYALARGEGAAALGHYEKAAEWDRFSAPVRRELAMAYSALNRPQEAVKALQEAVALAPQNAEYAFDLGLAWNEAGNLAAAEGAFTAAVKLSPGHARAWYNLGLARAGRGDLPGAIEALQRAEAADPTDPRTPYARATILAREGKLPEARAAANRALALQPDFANARKLLEQLGE